MDTSPWEPARVLKIDESRLAPGFRRRWVNKDQQGRVRKMQSEGWEIDPEAAKALGSEIDRTMNDGTPIEGALTVRELILMRLPIERAEARAKYFANLTDKRSAKGIDDIEKEGAKKHFYSTIEEE